jgi:hypothetical protein
MLQQTRKGHTSYVRYDLDADSIEVLLPEMTLKEAKRTMYDIQEILKRKQSAPSVFALDDYQSSQPPWIFRKLFGWQTIIKRA